jgi:hypothetical protein
LGIGRALGETIIKEGFPRSGQSILATGARLLTHGWRKVYTYLEAEDHLLPPLVQGDRLPVKEVLLEEKETQPPPRFTQSRLIQRMEELGLGTKSTRHEVIAKLLGRRYVEGNPLRPTPVGMAVIESLEDHADAITKPEMTRTLEADMQEIKVRNRTRDFVIGESREMLHRVFDALEKHGDEKLLKQACEGLCIPYNQRSADWFNPNRGFGPISFSSYLKLPSPCLSIRSRSNEFVLKLRSTKTDRSQADRAVGTSMHLDPRVSHAAAARFRADYFDQVSISIADQRESISEGGQDVLASHTLVGFPKRDSLWRVGIVITLLI